MDNNTNDGHSIDITTYNNISKSDKCAVESVDNDTNIITIHILPTLHNPHRFWKINT